MPNNKIGYIINESAATVSEVDIIESGNRVTAEGRLQTGNEKNRNGRRYLTQDLEREISAPRQLELLHAKQMFGEAGHPLSKELIRQQTIDPKCKCVSFLKFWMRGDDVMGRFKGTNNDLGECFDKDLREGCLPAFSLRALGSIANTREGAVVENLKMITYDHVIYPSHPGAYTEGIVSESAIVANTKKSNFRLTEANDATKSIAIPFTNVDVIKAISERQDLKEAAIDYVKDKSRNYYLIKECFDLTGINSVDFINNHQISLTESGVGTIVLDVEDYISKEIQNYAR